jgi:NADH-quinone oxidoreductase subunit K
MVHVAVDHVLALSAMLFAVGLAGVLLRRNLLFVLMSIEVMLNAAGLAFVTAGWKWAQADGQILFIIVVTLAAAEASVGLALILRLDRIQTTVDGDAVSHMRG